MAKLRPFGKGSLSERSGYALPILLGHLEGLASEEEESLSASERGRKWKRYLLVEDAIHELNEAMGMGDEEE